MSLFFRKNTKAPTLFKEHCLKTFWVRAALFMIVIFVQSIVFGFSFHE